MLKHGRGLVQPEDRVHVDIAIWNNDRLQIEIIAPFYKKNASPTDEVKLQGQPPTWKLWEYDVVEIFFVCANGIILKQNLVHMDII